METRLRMLLVLAGLPEPVVNLRIRDSNGDVVLRFDLAYPELKIAVEYDGRQHRADLDQWDRDQDRQDWFDDGGWRHITVISRGIYRTPDRTVARVARALASRGVPVQPTDEWRAYFTS
jgi:very-short-patch-repair endonuclease